MKTLVLLSGGLDSLTALAHVLADPNVSEVHALSFDYGQLNLPEIQCAIDVCRAWGVPHEVRPLHLVERDPRLMIPARNLIFIAHAAAEAIRSGYDNIVVGAEPEDIHADSSVAFLQACDVMLHTLGVRLQYPLKVLRDRADVVNYALSLGVPLHKCHSSHTATIDGNCRTSSRFHAAIEKCFIDVSARTVLTYLAQLRVSRTGCGELHVRYKPLTTVHAARLATRQALSMLPRARYAPRVLYPVADPAVIDELLALGYIVVCRGSAYDFTLDLQAE